MLIYAKPKSYVANNLEALYDHENVAVISITNSEDEPIVARSQKYLPLVFDDLRPSTAGTATAWDSEILVNIRNSQPMTYKQAMLLHYFIEQLPKEVDTIIVHCSAGISRSGGVARFLSETLPGVNEERFAKDNPQIQPNTWVHDLLWATYWERQNDRDD